MSVKTEQPIYQVSQDTRHRTITLPDGQTGEHSGWRTIVTLSPGWTLVFDSAVWAVTMHDRPLDEDRSGWMAECVRREHNPEISYASHMMRIQAPEDAADALGPQVTV